MGGVNKPIGFMEIPDETVPQSPPVPAQPPQPQAGDPVILEPMAAYRTKSRLARGQSRLFMRQTAMLVGLSVLLLLVVIRFGIPLLIKLAVVLGDIRTGNRKDPKASEEILTLVPPVLQPLPEATNSANLAVEGFAEAGQTVAVFLNTNPLPDVTADNDGECGADLKLRKGDNSVWAIVRGGNKESEKSEEMLVTFDDEAPTLTIDSPQEGNTVAEDSVEVRGLLNEEVHLTVNGRQVNQQSDNSFVTTLTLQEGENTITVFAKDTAGNAVTQEMKVTYEP